jgi:hypothetical protein
VRLAIGGLKVQMNEFMVQPVPKQEFAKYSKILSEYDDDDDEMNAVFNTFNIAPST